MLASTSILSSGIGKVLVVTHRGKMTEKKDFFGLEGMGCVVGGRGCWGCLWSVCCSKLKRGTGQVIDNQICVV